MEHLTTSYVINQSHLSSFLLQQKDLIFDNSSPYYLVIYSLTARFMKIIIYPVKILPIRKYLISGKQIQHESLEELLNHLSNEDCIIIHTSGIIYKHNRFFYEIYFTGLDSANLAYVSKKITQISGIDFLHDSIIRVQE